MSMEVAGLYTTLTMADEAFIAATTKESAALEEVAAASEVASAKVAEGAAEQAAAVEASAAEQVAVTEASRGRMATAWSNFTTSAGAKFKALGGQVQAGMSGIAKGVEKESLTAEQAWGKVTKAGEVSGLALIGIGAESLKMASDFQSTMEQVHTQAGAAQSEVVGLSQKVLALAPAVGLGPDKLAEGLYHIESSGMRGQAALDTLTQAAKLAQIGMADLDDVTFAMSGVMAIGMKDVHNAADAISYMNATVGMGDMRMDKLTAAIGTGILPVMKSAGLGMADFAAGLATIADNSVPADEAATRLRHTIMMMDAPTQKSADAMKAIGLSQTRLAEDMRKPNGLMVATMDLKKHLGALNTDAEKIKANQTLSDIFGGAKTASTMMTLVEESGKLKSKYDQMGTAAKRAATTQDAWAQTQATFKQQLHQVGAQFQVIGINIGTMLMPPLEKFFGYLAGHQDVVKVALGIIAAGMVALTMAVVANTLAMLANPTVWIVMGIVAAVVLLAAGIYELVKHWSTVWGSIKHIASDVWGALVTAWHATINALVTAAKWVKTKIIDPIVHFFMNYLWPIMKGFFAVFVWIFKFAFGFISVIVGDFINNWKIGWAIVSAVAKWAYDNILKPVADFIVTYVIGPIVTAAKWLGDRWTDIWHALGDAAKWVYDNVLHPVGTFIMKYVFDPIGKGLDDLKTCWDKAWNGIKAVVKTVWDFLSPIFDKIASAVDKVKDAISFVAHSPGKVGAAVAHLIGLDQGGWVPGAPGAPMLAVVHGGEFMVSRDMLAGRAATPIQVGHAGSVGASQPAQSIIHNHVHVYLDGQELQGANIRSAGRNKLRNATTGLN